MEFDLIARIRARAATRDDVILGIGDDAALLQVPAGMQLVVAMDTLNAGVHFPLDTAAADVGWKALAVNLSDLAAMGAQPAWCTLSLSLPQADAAWLDAFLDGFFELASDHAVALVGGDTTRGPLSVCVTVHGFVAPGRALRRDGAHVGDDVWVSGTLGDAAAALRLLLADRGAAHASGECGECGERASGAAALPRVGAECEALLARLRPRLDRPTPRVVLGRALGGLAHGAIDVSDGLLADLAHLCRASGVGAMIDIDALPASSALRDGFATATVRTLRASGGDDYELCFTAAPRLRERLEQLASETGVALTRIGRITAGTGIQARTAAGEPWQPPAGAGYVHFG